MDIFTKGTILLTFFNHFEWWLRQRKWIVSFKKITVSCAFFSAFKASFFGAFQTVSFHFQRDLFSQATYKAKEWLCVTKSSSWRIFHQLCQENWWISSRPEKKARKFKSVNIATVPMRLLNFSRHWLNIHIHSSNEWQTLNMTTDPNC